MNEPKIHCRRNKKKTFCGRIANHAIKHVSKQEKIIDITCVNCNRAISAKFIKDNKELFDFFDMIQW